MKNLPKWILPNGHRLQKDVRREREQVLECPFASNFLEDIVTKAAIALILTCLRRSSMLKERKRPKAETREVNDIHRIVYWSMEYSIVNAMRPLGVYSI